MATPRPDIVDDVPRCSKLCGHYLLKGSRGREVITMPTCEITADEWPQGRLCLPEIKRLVREAQCAKP